MDKYELKRKMHKDISIFHKKNQCTHDKTELRKRILKNGAPSYVYQCLTCGKAIGTPIKTKEAILKNESEEFTQFNDSLASQVEQDYLDEVENIKNKYEDLIIKAEKLNEEKNDTFWKEYHKYLKTDVWKEKRLKVLKRANYICEGCLENKATEVHHLTYKHLSNELLFELVAICDSCHKVAHNETSDET